MGYPLNFLEFFLAVSLKMGVSFAHLLTNSSSVRKKLHLFCCRKNAPLIPDAEHGVMFKIEMHNQNINLGA